LIPKVTLSRQKTLKLAHPLVCGDEMRQSFKLIKTSIWDMSRCRL
jgi:hypothetical protein